MWRLQKMVVNPLNINWGLKKKVRKNIWTETLLWLSWSEELNDSVLGKLAAKRQVYMCAFDNYLINVYVVHSKCFGLSQFLFTKSHVKDIYGLLYLENLHPHESRQSMVTIWASRQRMLINEAFVLTVTPQFVLCTEPHWISSIYCKLNTSQW